MPKKIVSVRGREGTPTRDISIPAGIARDHDIELGDEFAIEAAIDDEGRLVLRYTLVEGAESDGTSQ